jgi:hypothetical protein
MHCIETEAFKQLELYLITEAIGSYGDSHHHAAFPEFMHEFSVDYALKCCNRALVQGQAIHRSALKRITKKLQGATEPTPQPVLKPGYQHFVPRGTSLFVNDIDGFIHALIDIKMNLRFIIKTI